MHRDNPSRETGGTRRANRIIARIHDREGCAPFMNAEPSLNQRENKRLKTRGQILGRGLGNLSPKKGSGCGTRRARESQQGEHISRA